MRAKTEEKAYDLSQLNFLVVDDNKYMLVLLKEILRALNVRTVQTAEDGADALKILKTYAPDIIITDWSMSPLDGLDFIDMVRRGADTANPYVPVIMLTGHTEYHRVLDAINHGISEFLAKPVSASTLYQRIVNVIERPRQFIRCKRYVGPDRRRRSAKATGYSGKLRRKEDTEGAADGGEKMSVSDIDAMFS